MTFFLYTRTALHEVANLNHLYLMVFGPLFLVQQNNLWFKEFKTS